MGLLEDLKIVETEPRGDPPPPAPLVRSGPKASKSKLQDDTLVSGGAKATVNKYALLVKRNYATV